MREVTADTIHGKFAIMPTWCGKNIAIHRRIIGVDADGPVFSATSKNWIITHIKTGQSLSAFRLYGCTLVIVKQLAEAWDNAIGKIDPAAPRDWTLYEQWQAACTAALDGVVIPPIYRRRRRKCATFPPFAQGQQSGNPRRWQEHSHRYWPRWDIR